MKKFAFAYTRFVAKPLRWLGFVLALVVFLDSPIGSARSAQLSAAGFSFSDELGGFRLISVTGQGTAANPFDTGNSVRTQSRS